MWLCCYWQLNMIFISDGNGNVFVLCPPPKYEYEIIRKLLRDLHIGRVGRAFICILLLSYVFTAFLCWASLWSHEFLLWSGPIAASSCWSTQA